MRQDWVEFITGRRNKKFCVRPEYIIAFDEAVQEDEVVLYSEAGDKIIEYSTCEPYEQVKQKIMDAEKVYSGDVVVEHFTRDEYEMMLEWASTEYYYFEEHNQKLRNSIYNRLTKILKEEE